MARQTFKRGQRVFICVRQRSKYQFPHWIPARVIEPEAVRCPNVTGSYYHFCTDRCTKVPNPQYVKVAKGKSRYSDIVRNAKNIIVDEETGKQIVADLTAEEERRDRRRRITRLRRRVEGTIEADAIPMVKAIKRALVVLEDDSRSVLTDNPDINKVAVASRTLRQVLDEFKGCAK